MGKKPILGWKLDEKSSWKLQARLKLRVTTRQFSGQEGFLEEKHLDKHFMHDIQKKGSAGENFLVFSSRYS